MTEENYNDCICSQPRPVTNGPTFDSIHILLHHYYLMLLLLFLYFLLLHLMLLLLF